ncbi:HDOD domain-containing protein [Pseudoalteromonas sp. SSDWG2]|uniref:HDOD domain-containing protein n=1 Tax=Pseudoalteromonas sp. SSDWG2 TaxID=3139391 RepID=UPI003BA9715D
MQRIDEQILSQLEAGFKLPVKPKALHHLQEELNQPEPCLDKVSELIAADVAMSAAVLRVVNTPGFAPEPEIADIKYAVILLGLNTISHITSRYLLKQIFRQENSCISLARFWDTSTEISRLCGYLGQAIKQKTIPTDNLQTLGLFHDIGIPMMAMNFPDYVDVLNEANDSISTCLTELEDKRYPCNHAILGFYMAHSWHLPRILCSTVLRHHDIDFLDEPHTQEEKIYYSILKVAENIAHVHKRFRNINHWATLKPKILKTLDWQESEYEKYVNAGESLLIYNTD